MASSSCLMPPGPPRPVSTSTTPLPAASAHAFTCGTPGQGSGSRSRQTPGRTRSARVELGEAAADASRAGDLTQRGCRPAPHALHERVEPVPGDRRLERLGEYAGQHHRVAQVGGGDERLAPGAGPTGVAARLVAR